MAAAQEYEITGLTPSDFDEWSALFHAYIDFYKSVLPDDQYKKTFERILETREGLDAVVMRETEGDKKMVGLAHFFPQQSPWSEKKFLFLNGRYYQECFSKPRSNIHVFFSALMSIAIGFSNRCSSPSNSV